MLHYRSDYRSPLHAVERVSVHFREERSRSDFTALYAVAAGAGMVTGYILTLLV